jgi:phosphoribosylpyrophosphate synthetase
MIDTGGTLAKAADLMMEKGALSVRAICTHAILSEVLTKNRKFSIIRTNSYGFYPTEETIRQDKSVELCSSLCMLCTWCTITIPLVESL